MRYEPEQVAGFLRSLRDSDTGLRPAQIVAAAREVAVEVVGIGFEHPGLRSAALCMFDLLDQAEELL